MSLIRVKSVIAYDGSNYSGFQQQTSTKQTITYAIEEALATLHIHTKIVGSGRTDAGVHATGQIIHFDLPEYWVDLKKLKLNLNRILSSIYFKHITFVSSDFHARFHAKKRLYRYVFKTHKPSVFEQKYVSYYSSFDTKLLQLALDSFVGKHDFNFFRKTGSDTYTSVREIYQSYYVQRGSCHFIYFSSNGFLRAQVRMMIHAAMLCAQKKLSIDELKEQINCNKRHTTHLSPPEGLYLAKIFY
jgi:tRNA pseudouridine38-40 synthase